MNHDENIFPALFRRLFTKQAMQLI